MGRLAGIPYFLSQDAFDSEKNDLSLSRAAKRGAVDEDAAELAARACYVDAAQRMQAYFKDRILRRGVSSLDWLGQPLVSLPPCIHIFLVVKPTAREMAIITELADRIKTQ